MPCARPARPFLQNAIAVALATGITAVSLLALHNFALQLHPSSAGAEARAPRDQSITFVQLPREPARTTQPAHGIPRRQSVDAAYRSGVADNINTFPADTAAAGTVPVAPGHGNRPVLSPRASSPEALAAAVDSVIRAAINAHNDSAVVPTRLRLPDWTVKLGNQRYGMSPGRLRLGVVSIPLPGLRAALNIQERERIMSVRRDHIITQARQAENAIMFRQAVRDTRLRIEQERLAQRQTRQANDAEDR